MGTTTLKNLQYLSTELNMHIPYDSEMPLFDIHPREINVHPKDTYKNVHSTISIIGKKLKNM